MLKRCCEVPYILVKDVHIMSANPTTDSPHSGSQPLSKSSMMPGMPHLNSDVGHKCEKKRCIPKKVVVVKAAGKYGLAAALTVDIAQMLSFHNRQACYLHVQVPRSNCWPWWLNGQIVVPLRRWMANNVA